tara:strand:- start:84 stop:374 length:291 start_codon:yes stop_codon:yes gene_type:complete
MMLSDISQMRPQTIISEQMPEMRLNYKDIEKKYSLPPEKKIPGKIMKVETDHTEAKVSALPGMAQMKDSKLFQKFINKQNEDTTPKSSNSRQIPIQ